MTKGFITVATGKWYYSLAINLFMSYKLFSNCNLPFYVITDKAGEKKLKKYFDGVIVIDNPHYNFLDKIDVYKNSPFDETIFLDADMNIVKDISFLFDEFEKNGSEVSCYGSLVDINGKDRTKYFGKAAINFFGLKQTIGFGGGIYYYKKSVKANELIDFIYSDLMPNYDKYELLHIGAYYGDDIRRMADESLMCVAMLVFNMKPLNTVPHLMRYSFTNMMQNIKWDIDNQDCSFVWWGETVHPYIVHYATPNTWTYKYCKLNIRVRNKYYKTNKLFSIFTFISSSIKWAFTPRQIKRFLKWFSWHFTPSYWKEKLTRNK